MTRVHATARRLAGLVTLPAALAHELTHAIAALPWADRLALVVDPMGVDAAVHVDYRSGTPGWVRTVVGYAPFALGLTLGVAAIARVVMAGLPTDVDLAWAAILGLWWAVYVVPSADDRHGGARGPGTNGGGD